MKNSLITKSLNCIPNYKDKYGMSTIFGVLYKRDFRFSMSSIEELISKLDYWRPDKRYTHKKDEILLCNLLLSSTPESLNEHKSSFISEDNCFITSDSRLDYRKELVLELGECWDEYKDFPDNYLIIQSYLKWGKDCVKHLFGDFAFAIWNENSSELFCARDQFGARPLYFIDYEEFFIFSSDHITFNLIPEISAKLDENYIIDSICSISPEKNSSAYENVQRLEPANYITINRNGLSNRKKYWDLTVDRSVSEIKLDQAILELRMKFQNSVDQKNRTPYPIGLELSGGLDSSSIASCILENSANFTNPIYTFSHSMLPKQHNKPNRYLDIAEFCEDIINKDRITKGIYVTGEGKEGGLFALTNFLNINLKPLVQSYAMMSDQLYLEAKRYGVRILFSGFGGDEGITNSGARYIEELAIQKKWEQVKYELGLKYYNDLGMYYLHYSRLILKTHLPHFHNVVSWLKNLGKNTYLKRLQIFAYNSSFEKESGLKRRYIEKGIPKKVSTVKDHQYRMITHDHISIRLENSYYAARDKKVEYRYPFLDVKLVEYYYSLKSEFKYRNGLNRYIFRQAMKGIVSDKIRLEQKKYSNSIPNVMHRLMVDEDLIKSIINESRIKNNYHYVNYDRLLWMIEQMKDEKSRKSMKFSPNMFSAPLSVLILQKWQREGKIDIGIKC